MSNNMMSANSCEGSLMVAVSIYDFQYERKSYMQENTISVFTCTTGSMACLKLDLYK